MKADQKTQSEVLQSFKGMFEAYKKKDLQATLAFWASDADIVIIGTGEDEKGSGVSYLSESLQRDWSQGEIQAIGVKNFLVSAAGVVAWLSADVTFNYKVPEGQFDLPTRLSGVMEKRNGRWLWVQMHVSTPSCGQEHGRSWPNP